MDENNPKPILFAVGEIHQRQNSSLRAAFHRCATVTCTRTPVCAYWLLTNKRAWDKDQNGGRVMTGVRGISVTKE